MKKFSFRKSLPIAINLQPSPFLTSSKSTRNLLHIKVFNWYANYAQIGSNKKCPQITIKFAWMWKRCRFYPERANFNLNLSRHFYCYLSAPHVCVWMWFPTGIKGRKWGRAGTSWCQLIEKLFYLRFTISTNSLASTCYNLNLTQLSTNISPTPTKG